METQPRTRALRCPFSSIDQTAEISCRGTHSSSIADVVALGQGELTLGQLVAAEVVVASLPVNLESVIKRTYIVFYFFSALTELDALFSLPDDAIADGADSVVSIPRTSN